MIASEPFAGHAGVGLRGEHGPHAEAIAELGGHQRIGGEHDRARTRRRRASGREQLEISVGVAERRDEIELVEPARLAHDDDRTRLTDREHLDARERRVPFGVKPLPRDHRDVLARQVRGGRDLHAGRRDDVVETRSAIASSSSSKAGSASSTRAGAAAGGVSHAAPTDASAVDSACSAT